MDADSVSGGSLMLPDKGTAGEHTETCFDPVESDGTIGWAWSVRT
jgi:hypothetical protein